MNLSDRQRRLVFAGLVVLLAGIGVFLTVSQPDSEDDPEPSALPSVSAGPTGPASPPPGIPGQVDPGRFDVYRLLPFSRTDAATAADLAQRFVAAYGTYRFDEQPQAYVGRLRPLVTEALLGELERGATAPGLVEQRRQQKVVAAGTATLDRIRDIEDNSIIFLVTGVQEVTKGSGTSRDSKQYAVTVARDGASLRVYAFQPADVGQQGDTG